MSTDFSKVDALMDKMMKDGMENLGNTIRKRAIVLAPKDSGDLRKSARVDVSLLGDTATISFNTAYAKRRHYENNLHPATRLYLTNSLRTISSPAKFFKRFF